METWYKTAFSKDYIRIYQHRNHSEAENAIESLLAYITLPDHPLCLDLGCGFGRHLMLLNQKGIRTYGIDLSSDLLRVASEGELAKGLLARADMRNIPFRSRFDFVFSFFSSFGYFIDDGENLKVLKEINRVLKPTGGYVIDYMNASYVERNLVAEDSQQFPDFQLVQKRWVNRKTNSIEKDLIVKDENGETVIRESLKLYGVDDFHRLCQDAGLAITKLIGDYEGSPFGPESSRLILIGEKSGISP